MKTLAQSFINSLYAHPHRYILAVGLIVFLCQYKYYHELAVGVSKAAGRDYTQTLVVGHMKQEDLNWIQRELPALNTAIYAVEDPSAPLQPPINKGHESMSYLTYIIDNYHNLSDTTIFIHAHQKAWHNNDLFDFDMARMLRRLSNEHVPREGFFNLRCHPESGCPAHINLDATIQDPLKREETCFAKIWPELHGGDPMPKTLGAPCCSQFAASRERLRSVSRAMDQVPGLAD